MQSEVQTITDFKAIDEFIDGLETEKGALISVLHRAQDIYGYLPKELQQHIALKLGIPSSKVYGVVTFYSFLKMEPKGRIPVNICLGTACFVRGADKIVAEFEDQLDLKVGEVSSDGMFSLDTLRCVGACGLAPVVMVGDQTYGRVTVDDVKDIVDEQMAKEDWQNGQ